MDTCMGTGSAGHTVAAALQFFATAQCLLGEPWPNNANIQNETTVDFIIVGAGTAGATLAARLSELPVTVLLIEAGGDPPTESIIPYFKHEMKGSPYDWNFTTVNNSYSSQALQGGIQHQPRGKMLGGTGSINDMIYARGFPVDYDEWASIVGNDWNWNNVLKYFKKTERLTDERIINNRKLAVLHGFDGEIEVSGSIDYSFTTKKILEAFEQLHFKIVDDMTNPYKIGVGQFSLTVKNGKRDSSLTALLNHAAVKDNLYILKNAQVTNILIEKGITYGVKVLIDDEEFNFYSEQEVIVSAGTFNTAKLLLLSGIGPKEHLQELGINVLSDLPVGENFHDHTMVLTYIPLENGTCEFNEKELYLDTIKYLYDKTGILSKSPAIGAYVSFNRRNVPDFAFYPTCMSLKSNFYEFCMSILGWKERICKKIDLVNQNKEILNVAVLNLKPSSRGRVKLKSTNPIDSPLIHSGTFDDPKDLEHYPDALNIAWSLVNTSYFKEKKAYVLDLEIEDCEDKQNEERAKCIAQASAMSAWHAVGTAAMGSVVDSNLRVYGITGLRIVDASVMPKIIRGNTNAPVVMIAEKAFDFIKEYYNYA